MTSPSTRKFNHAQLLQALYWVWDAFDRTLMGMFLVYDTADAVLHDKDLYGDAITVGTRKLEWKSGSVRILKAFTGEPVETTPEYEVFKNPFNDVPVRVYIFKDDSCITSPDTKMYIGEAFQLPNPYTRFLSVYGGKP